MNNVIPISATVRTMTSIELLELVNQARVEFGETEVRRNDFTARCRDELDGEHYETFVVENANGTESAGIKMTRDQCMYVLMRESKAVRRAVTAKLNGATPAHAIPVKYRHPATGREWSGRGRTPLWLRGVDREAYRVGEQA